MRTLLLLIVFLVGLSGCAGSFEEARAPRVTVGAATQDRCDTVDDQHAAGVFVAETSGALAGGSGLGSILVDDSKDDLQLGLAIGAAAAGAIAAGSSAYASDRASVWAKECAGP